MNNFRTVSGVHIPRSMHGLRRYQLRRSLFSLDLLEPKSQSQSREDMPPVEGRLSTKDCAFRMYQLRSTETQCAGSRVLMWTQRTGIEGGSGKDPVHQPSAHSDKQGGSAAKPSLKEDGC